MINFSAVFRTVWLVRMVLSLRSLPGNCASSIRREYSYICVERESHSTQLICIAISLNARLTPFSEEEQQRGITMKSSAISLLHTKEIRQRPGSTPPTVADPAPQESPGEKVNI